MSRLRGDEGVSLVEMLVAMVLTALLGTITVSAVSGTSKVFRLTDQESLGQTDVRTTIERLGRDVRNARSLDAGASASQLVLWIDSNSDYVKQPSEIVTWRLVAGTNGHYDVARVANGLTTRTARLVISQLAFSYRKADNQPALSLPLTQTQADSVRLVDADILYAADAVRALAARHTQFSERMRNVP